MIFNSILILNAFIMFYNNYKLINLDNIDVIYILLVRGKHIFPPRLKDYP